MTGREYERLGTPARQGERRTIEVTGHGPGKRSGRAAGRRPPSALWALLNGAFAEGIVPLCLLMLAWNPGAGGSYDALGRCVYVLAIGLPSFFLAMNVATVTHECGHAVMGYLIGGAARPLGVCSGVGLGRVEIERSDGKWILRRGSVNPRVIFGPDIDADPIALRLCALAGPLANAIAAVCLVVSLGGFYQSSIVSMAHVLALAGSHPLFALPGLPPPSRAAVFLFLVPVAQFTCSGNLVPWRPAGRPSDGWILWHGNRH